MRLLRTLARVAFICNICFLLTIAQRYLPALPEDHFITKLREGDVGSTILVLAFGVGAIVNILLNLVLLILAIIGRLRRTGIPVWLLVANFLIFIFQVYIFSIRFIHDSQHP